jgi:hypothetical protein
MQGSAAGIGPGLRDRQTIRAKTLSFVDHRDFKYNAPP